MGGEEVMKRHIVKSFGSEGRCLMGIHIEIGESVALDKTVWQWRTKMIDTGAAGSK